MDGVLSSIALQDLVLSLDPPAPPEIQAAARRLRYRDLCLVALMTSEEQPFEDNWIYVHDPGTRAGRIQNYGAWSEAMVKPGTTCLGVEYFCFEGDEIWSMPDDEAVELAKAELAGIGLIDPEQGLRRRQGPRPQGLSDVRRQLRGGCRGDPRLPAGDSRTSRPSAGTGFIATTTRITRCGRRSWPRSTSSTARTHDVWSVNVEEEYLEEGQAVDAALNFDLLAGSEPRREDSGRAGDSELLNL